MAFGGGALLAALTIDLVAPSLGSGHFPQLSLGMFIGGAMFMLLNEAVNDYGGFLRKVSTTVYHLRAEKHSEYKRILVDVGRIDLFQVLFEREYKALVSYIRTRHCPGGRPYTGGAIRGRRSIYCPAARFSCSIRPTG